MLKNWFGPYVVSEMIGDGSFAEVFAARKRRSVVNEGGFAIKVLRADHQARPDFRDRFVNEAHTLTKLRHENIVRYYSYGKHWFRGDYIVMELLDGERLDHRIRRGSIGEAEAVHIAMMILRGLSEVHQKGFVHRDVKPENIQLCSDGRAVLMDFGIAKQPAGRSAGTEVGQAIGTAPYASPEQNQGGAVDRRSDIFSVGVVIHEMIHGRRPYGDSENPHTVYQEQLRTGPAPAPLASPELQATLARALAMDPLIRYSDCESMLKDLEEIVPPEARVLSQPPAGAIPTGGFGVNRGTATIRVAPAPTPASPRPNAGSAVGTATSQVANSQVASPGGIGSGAGTAAEPRPRTLYDSFDRLRDGSRSKITFVLGGAFLFGVIALLYVALEQRLR